MSVAMLAACSQNGGKEKTVPRRFINDVMLGMTPVKNQGSTPLCWAYAMLATIETEHIGRGDSVNLSTAYVARMFMMEQADRCYLSRGSIGITLRGVMPQLVRLIQMYGLMPYDSYHSDANLNVAARKLQGSMRMAATHGKGIGKARSIASELLDNSVNPLPRHVYMYSMEYTPQEFAHSVCMPDEYQAFTSFTHEPMDRRVRLNLPDNYDGEMFVNIPIDSLMQMVERSVSSGHPVCWEGDISEEGFSFSSGVADVPQAKRNCSQQLRQREFDALRTTDDHCMAIIGIAHDTAGRRYFVCKNSWGTDNPYGGLMYMSFDYARLKTVAVMVNAVAVK